MGLELQDRSNANEMLFHGKMCTTTVIFFLGHLLYLHFSGTIDTKSTSASKYFEAILLTKQKCTTVNLMSEKHVMSGTVPIGSFITHDAFFYCSVRHN